MPSHRIKVYPFILDCVLQPIKSLILLSLLLSSVALFADAPPDEADKATTEAQLAQLNSKIIELQAQMHSTRSRYSRLQRLLQRSEVNISEFNRQITLLTEQATAKQQQLDNLSVEAKHYQQALTIQQQQLAQQLRTAYISGRQNYLKLWLNQQDPFSIGRLLTYHDYFNRARTQQLVELRALQQQLAEVQQQMLQERNDLNELIAEQNQEQNLLQQSVQQRQQVLANLANSLQHQTEQLEQLQTDKQRLQRFLQELDAALATLPPPAGTYPKFASLKGQLPYPLTGQLLKRFGHKRIDNLKWEGLLIKARAGQPIHAVAAGRVIFAEWFRNLGLLVIIEHGQGYMSLYAHQQTLQVTTGDWLEAGALVGEAGNSGGQADTALYFELRYQGVPINPLPWLVKG